MRTNRAHRTIAVAVVALTAAIAACTPAGTAAPTGPAGGTGGPSSPAATDMPTATAGSTPAATTPAATTVTPTTAATPAPMSPGASPAAVSVAYATFAPRAGSSTSVTGAATLIEANGSTMVVIGVVPSGTDPIAAAIQEGTCASPNPLIKFPLTNLVSGASITSVNVALADVLATDHVINLFVAGSETESSISCGDIQELPASTP